MIWKCNAKQSLAKRARRHIVNYDILDNELHAPTEQKSFSLIEKMSVERKSHRNAKDFACIFFNNITIIFLYSFSYHNK